MKNRSYKKDKGIKNPKGYSEENRIWNSKRNKKWKTKKEEAEKKFEKLKEEKEFDLEVIKGEEFTYNLNNWKKVAFWNVNQNKNATTDILKISNFDIIGLNEVGKEVILDDYNSFIVTDGEKVSCQLLCKKQLRAKKLWCNQNGDFIAVELENEVNQGCIIIVSYLNPTYEKADWREDTIESLNELIFGRKDDLRDRKKIIMGDFNYDFRKENYKNEKVKVWSQEMCNLKHDLIFKSVKDFSHRYKKGTGIS